MICTTSASWPPAHAAEALECLGGNGYVEESGLPRLYREEPLQSIREVSGTVAALDALRALTRPAPTLRRSFQEQPQKVNVLELGRYRCIGCKV